MRVELGSRVGGRISGKENNQLVTSPFSRSLCFYLRRLDFYFDVMKLLFLMIILKAASL